MRRGYSWLAVLALVVSCSPSRAGGDSAVVRRGTLVMNVDVTGTLRAVDSDRIGPPGLPRVWDYKISMMAPEGSEVAEGDPVVGFDITDLKRRLDEKVAKRDSTQKQLETKRSAIRVAEHDAGLELADAKAALRKAELQADAPDDIVASIELQKLRLDVELATAKVAYLKRKAKSTRRRDNAELELWRRQHERASERVEQITDGIDRMTAKAPRAGTVIYNANWRGEKKKVGDNAWRAETVLQVVSLAEMEAAGEVDEVDAAKLAVDQAVSLRLDAQPDVELRGRIRDISLMVQRQSPENPLKIVRIDIALDPDQELRLRPGMRFRGGIETERVEDALLVPIDTIVATPSGPVARRRTSTGTELVPVTVGRRNAHDVEVTGGLSEGDELERAGLARAKEPAT